MGVSGKTVLITGAAGGLGSALAMRCAEAGTGLVLLDKNRQGLVELSDRITDKGLSAPGLYPMDIAGVGVDDFNELVSTVRSEFNGLSAVIHCALEFGGLQPFEQVKPADWLHSMQVNVNAPWLLSCTCLPLLKEAGDGRLFFLLDDLDAVTDAYWGAYGTAKAALTGMVRQLHASLSNTSVVVRGIIPGPMRTAFRATVYHAENPLDQPPPSVVAKRIVEMLDGDISGSELIVDFSN